MLQKLLAEFHSLPAIFASGSISNGYAELSIRSRSYGGNPFLEFGGSFKVVETSGGISSSSSAFVRSGNL